MSKRSWVLLGVGGLIIAAMLVPVAAGGTRGAPERAGFRTAAQPGIDASLASSRVPIRCEPGEEFGSVSVPVGITKPRADSTQKQGTNALVSWTIDRSSVGSNKRFVPYNTPAKLRNSRVPCSVEGARLVCHLRFKLHPLRLHLVCHRVKPAS